MSYNLARKELDRLITEELEKEKALARLRRIVDRIKQMPEEKQQRATQVLWVGLQCVMDRRKGHSQ